MKKFKDLIYDYNDIFVAILIVILAGVIISWRIGDIMAYPKYLAEQTEGEALDITDIDLSLDILENINNDPENIVTDPTTGQAIEIPPDLETPTPNEDDLFITAKETSITIPVGVSGSKIAEILYEAKLIASPQHFIDAVSKKNAETKLKAATFKIPAGSTVEDIVTILTR